jgi:glycosidase
MKEVGIKMVYLITIWSNHSYTPDDYYKISSKYETEQDLKELVETVHKYDMKILLDLVTGYSNSNPDNFIYNNHPEWHLKDRQGNILRFYPDRRGPAIDRTNPEVIKYFTEVAKYYVQKYNNII